MVDSLATGLLQGERPKPILIQAAAPGLTSRLVLETVSGERQGDSILVRSVYGYLLLRRAPPASTK